MKKVNVYRFEILFQENYIIAAAGLSDVEKARFGLDGEYFLLSQKCFKYRSPSYVYELCPFKERYENKGSEAF